MTFDKTVNVERVNAQDLVPGDVITTNGDEPTRTESHGTVIEVAGPFHRGTVNDDAGTRYLYAYSVEVKALREGGHTINFIAPTEMVFVRVHRSTAVQRFGTPRVVVS